MVEQPGERLQAAALASVANAVMITDADGVIVWANDAFTRMSGYSRDEAVGSTPRLLKSGKHGDDHYERLWRTILAGRTWRGEVVDRRKDGELYTVFQTVTPILGDDGAPTHFVAVHEDVSDLRSSQAQLQALYDHAADAIVLFDADVRVVDANPAACALAGLDHDVFIGTKLPTLLADLTGVDLDAEMVRFTREGRGRGRAVVRRPDGAHIAVAFQAVADITPGVHLLIAQDETAQRAAEEQQRFQAQLLDAVGEAVVATDLDGVLRYWSPSATRMYGWSQEEAIGRRIVDLVVPPEGRERAATLLAQGRAGQEWSGEFALRRRDGRTVETWTTIAPYRDARGEVAGLTGVAADITEVKRAQALLAQRVREHELVAEFAQEAVGSPSPRELAARAEARVVEALAGGALASGQLGDWVEAIVVWGAERATSPGAEGGTSQGATPHDVDEIEVPIGDSGALVVRVEAGSVLDAPQRHFLVTVAHILDAAVRREATDAQLQQLATHDPLTGLPNRVLLLDRLAQVRAATARHQRRFVLVCLDLDGFKFVNEALGHDSGDDVLVEVADRLTAAVRAGETVARIGIDEFAVLTAEVQNGDEATTAAEADRVAERVRALFDTPLRASGTEVTLTASVGVVVGDANSEPAALLRAADTALHAAKDAGRNRVQRFDQRMKYRAAHRLDVTSALRHALDHGGIAVRYQPAYELATGRVVGAEALVRLPLPGGGMLTPDQFIRVAEDTGLIAELGHAVLARACADAVGWVRADPDFMLSVNLSPRELTHPELPATIERTLADTGMTAGALWLEITESALLSGPGVNSVLHQLRELGLHLTIDDFGTGYSSLAQLRHIPAEMLKIDRSFVANLTTNCEDRALVAAAIELAGAFGLTTTGEGVETLEHQERLAELGCRYGQGFLWSRPVPASELGALVEASTTPS